MPFTFAHPAAVIPLSKIRRLVPSALVMGSMAPDFPYFIALSMRQPYAHTFAGLFWFCVPAGIAALWLFHAVLKKPLSRLLPESHQACLAPYLGPFRFGPPLRFAGIALSVLAGAASHVAWDSLTHFGGPGTRIFPLLNTVLLNAPGEPIRVTDVLQVVSSAVGLSVMAGWYGLWRRSAGSPAAIRVNAWPAGVRTRTAAGLVLLAGLTAVLHAIVRVRGVYDMPSFRAFVCCMAVSGIAAMLIAITAWSLAVLLLERAPATDRTGRGERSP